MVFSDIKEIGYTPSRFVSSIKVKVSIMESSDKKKAINFTFTTKRNNTASNIKIDSIIFQSSVKSLILNNPYSDTVYLREDGGLYLSTTHLLKQDEIFFFKTEQIKNLTIAVDKQPYTIYISKKSQNTIKKLIDNNF